MTRPLDIFRAMLLAAFQAYLLSAAVEISRTALNKWYWLLQGLQWEALAHITSAGVSISLVLSLLVLLFSECTLSSLPLFFLECSSKFFQSSTLIVCCRHLILLSAWYFFSVLDTGPDPLIVWECPPAESVLSYFPRVSIICPYLQYLLNLTVLNLWSANQSLIAMCYS